MKNQGFTLVELLATITILGILSIVAIPNVVGIVNNNKDNMYIEDAKRLVSLAEYKFRSDTTINITSSDCVAFSLNYLDNATFDDAPNGGSYVKEDSYVVIRKEGPSYQYYVQLKEKLSSGGFKGVMETNTKDLNKTKIGSSFSSIPSCLISR